MIGYVKCFDSNKTMSFKVSDSKLLKKYNKIWERVSNLLNAKFDSKPVYDDNDKYIKTTIKLYGEFVIRANKKYYPQALLEECKYEIKKNKMENLVNDDLDLTSCDESDNESNGADSGESND